MQHQDKSSHGTVGTYSVAYCGASKTFLTLKVFFAYDPSLFSPGELVGFLLGSPAVRPDEVRVTIRGAYY